MTIELNRGSVAAVAKRFGVSDVHVKNIILGYQAAQRFEDIPNFEPDAAFDELVCQYAASIVHSIEGVSDDIAKNDELHKIEMAAREAVMNAFAAVAVRIDHPTTPTEQR